jgi:hypothetical protein
MNTFNLPVLSQLSFEDLHEFLPWLAALPAAEGRVRQVAVSAAPTAGCESRTRAVEVALAIAKSFAAKAERSFVDVERADGTLEERHAW